ncbi:MAG: ATP-binding protein [Acidobacteriota bacterium]
MRRHCRWAYLLRLTILLFASIVGALCVFAQGPIRKNILIITEVSETHPAIAMVTREIRDGLSRNPNYEIEFFEESMDASDFSNDVVEHDIQDAIRKYQQIHLDAIVAVGPTPVRFLATSPEPLFPKVPVVIAGGILETNTVPNLDSRFTGTWLYPDAAGTLDVALRLFPKTKHVGIVAGSSAFDRARLASIRADLQKYESRLDLVDLTGLELPALLNRLRQLPPDTVVLYSSFFQDANGKPTVNANTVLPMVAQVSTAPVFGTADSYLGRGIVGGKLMSFSDQGRAAVDFVNQLLAGKKPGEFPITIAPSIYMFDWRQLHRWHVDGKLLPAGSRVLFREATFWEKNSGRIVALGLLIFGLVLLLLYVGRERKQLRFAKHAQSELSGLLIGAQEVERGRMARELHDDFSQRVALLTLGLEAVAETIPKSPREADRQIHDLLTSTIELSADLHTLSHRLHSSTLENLGLMQGVASLCKEFQAQQKVNINFEHGDIQRSIDPDAALCIFRIVQEALRNVKKHSGSGQADVKLEVDESKAHVSVQDHGKGFDCGAMVQTGLGVRSMEERAHMLGGSFQLRSHPGEGTRVEAWVPLRPKEANYPSISAQ